MRISDWSSDVCLPISQRGSNSGDLDEEKAGENVERDDPDTGAPDVVKIAIECCCCGFSDIGHNQHRSEEHTSELQSLMRISYAVFCLKKKTRTITHSAI